MIKYVLFSTFLQKIRFNLIFNTIKIFNIKRRIQAFTISNKLIENFQYNKRGIKQIFDKR